MDYKASHILIVDDDFSLLQTMGDILELKGFESIAANTGRTALEQLEKYDFDVALVDLRLEDMSGLEVLHAIKVHSPDTECILLTGHATQNSAIEAIQLGVYGYFQKPLDMEQVLLFIQRAVEKNVAVKALRQSEEHYRAVAQTASDAIITANSEGQIVSWNHSAEVMFGYAEAEIIGQPLTLILPPRYPEDHLNGMARVQSGGEKHIVGKAVEVEGLHKSGNEFPLELSLSEWRSEKNIFFTAIIRDITERRQAEEQLRKLSHAVDQSPASVVITDLQGNIEYVNPKFSQITGYAFEEIVGQNPRFLKSGHTAQEEYKELWDTITSGRIWQGEFLNKKKNGDAFWELATISPVYNNSGNVMNFLALKEDITERKKAEESIHQRVRELELLYESGLSFSQLLNPREIAYKIIELLEEKLNWHHTVIRLVSKKNSEELELLAFDQHGLDSQTGRELVSKKLNKLISRSGEGLSGWALTQNKVVRIGNVKEDPHYIETYPGIQSGLYVPLKSGARILGVISLESKELNAFSEEDEHLIATLASQAAIALENARLYEETIRYAVELEERVQERTAEIETTRQRLELAVKTAGVGIWELNIRENKDYWDNKLFDLYGLSKENAQTSLETRQSAIHQDDLAQQKKIMDDALNHDQPYDTEFRVVWPDASIHHIKSNAILIRDANNAPERMIGADRDISIHKQAEETLRLANLEMERGLRMKNEFLANMSHELRTPLNAILGISESLEEQIAGSLNEKQLKYIRVINESGRHLLELINDILDLSKIEAGKLEINVQTISIEWFCASCLRMVKELAHKKDVDVLFKSDQKVQVILGDERRLKQALVNLLGNAVKFTPSGRKIGLEVSGFIEKNEVTFTVWDEGIGINQDDIPLLFKPFVQLNAGLSREYAGTGLGLALVAQMVRLHSGRIDLTSKIKEGSRFMVTLPWMPPEQNFQPPQKPLFLADKSIPNKKHTGRILVVDDTDLIAQLICDYLQNMGYETLIAEDGEEAVRIAKKEHPKVILMDVMMPVMNGIDATKRIREDASMADIPIIGLTALAMPEDRARCLAAGMNDHLSKPIQMQELAQVIERYMDNAKGI